MYSKKDVLDAVVTCGLIPVVRVSQAQQAIHVADALQRAGAPIIEITMTVPGALSVLEELSRSVGDTVILGAGTVLDAQTARLAILAGAQFVVAPTLDEATIQVCNRYAKVAIPGALTPTEILHAWELGADMVKVFPADAVGGPGYIKSIKAPLPHIDLVPTGGVDKDTTADFIRAGAAAVGVGSALVEKKILEHENYDALVENTKEYLRIIKEART
ncbi:MAG: bifunctional 4-hydroxy-2-oxoglutarate aldolase/2-dehydro-3-deoxy-phosphogluconate aldolase [Deltaproteobacteria bacterium]|nr:bifunctional 4-hydroxy-2-oxoglutarate aldolase/2-dehydro-3-deoxy-phosphogluconate aldolase [Deltaproteobacteria bacterium]MBW1960920.1 bifunctional 4-hydroxy-2-oxoglutarate aldolase/2-dehydro-3-deoxy-phosphogluconate aldolase [Deltaproteobacteria bacterium]MBW1992840.1 bifunctional 4-hydroxy-2-oxoglutarate aldolase/2-dehydro-3-deoxy-phosphogluconate aldolase [Deltaproteobacteria bacterium]MBW2154941.1 bifunctional 4-hydroxy-2-oxoglutarate aldolase/2-dehydro-3-deoxy-phosphogluconate aldolase [